MTEPDIAAVLRKMKVPELMVSSQALRDFLLNGAERGQAEWSSEEQSHLMKLLIFSHLEVLNALGALEESMTQQVYKKFHEDVEKFQKDSVRKSRGFLSFLFRR